MEISEDIALIIKENDVEVKTTYDKSRGEYSYVVLRREGDFSLNVISSESIYKTRKSAEVSGKNLVKKIKGETWEKF